MSTRVLILDDEECVGTALCRSLKRAGFEAIAVQEPDLAWAQLLAGDVAVLISDQRMPLCSGVEFLERCAHQFPKVSQILLTGHADPQIAIEAINRTEVMKYLSKPWNNADLLAAVREAAWSHELTVEE